MNGIMRPKRMARPGWRPCFSRENEFNGEFFSGKEGDRERVRLAIVPVADGESGV